MGAYYFVMGRVRGDDEDTGLDVGNHPSQESAMDAFTRLMEEAMTTVEIDEEIATWGQSVIISCVTASSSPIQKIAGGNGG